MEKHTRAGHAKEFALDFQQLIETNVLSAGYLRCEIYTKGAGCPN